MVGEIFLQQLSEKNMLQELTRNCEDISNNRYFTEQDMKYPTYAQLNGKTRKMCSAFY